MRVVSVDGKLQTTGSWSEEEEKVKKQRLDIAKLKADIRLILEGRPQEEPASVEAQVLQHVASNTLQVYDKKNCFSTVIVNLEFTQPVCRPSLGYLQGRSRIRPDYTQIVNLDFAKVEAHVLSAMVAKPPALWLKYSQIPEVERNAGLWHVKDPQDNRIYVAGYRVVADDDLLYMKAALSVKQGDDYDSSLYLHPDASGWFVHVPQPWAVCPVPSYLNYHSLRRDGRIIAGMPGHDCWKLHHEQPCSHDVVAWKVVD